jgi:hypothetical protein
MLAQHSASAARLKVQPQSAPPDCGFSTSATPKAFGAVSPAGYALSLQNCNDWQDKFWRGFCACRHNLWLAKDKFLIIFSQGCVFGFRLNSKEERPRHCKKVWIPVQRLATAWRSQKPFFVPKN